MKWGGCDYAGITQGFGRMMELVCILIVVVTQIYSCIIIHGNVHTKKRVYFTIFNSKNKISMYRRKPEDNTQKIAILFV